MRIVYLVYVAIIYCSVALSERTKSRELIESRDRNDNQTCQEDLFILDDSQTSNVSLNGRRRLRSDKVLDCFGLGAPFAQILDWFLKSEANGTKALNVKFYVTTRNNPDRVTLKHGDNFSLEHVDFNITKRTVLIVHGFLSDGDEKWIEDMTKAFLKWDDVNIVVVDWSAGSNTWNYYKAAVNTRTVGDQIATLFGQIVDASLQSNDVNENAFGPLHFIGHSLGAHICGYAALQIRKRESKWPVQRITGLDPAHPCFKNSDSSLRLDETDAPFVDIIHTNGRVLSRLGLGIPNPLGHVDFYPNGGRIQPGCILSRSVIWKLLPMPIKKITETICSHGRSYLYFIDSIMSDVKDGCTFWAHQWDMTYSNVDTIFRTKCNSEKCIEMGINAEKYNYNGTFLTITGRSRPFCNVDEDAKAEVKNIIEKVKKKLHCDIDDEPYNQTLVIYS